MAHGAGRIAHRAGDLGEYRMSNVELRILKRRKNFKIGHSLFNIQYSNLLPYALCTMPSAFGVIPLNPGPLLYLMDAPFCINYLLKFIL